LRKLVGQESQVVAEIAAPEAELKLCWEQLPEVEYFDIAPSEGDFLRCSLTGREGVDLRQVVFDTVNRKGWKLRELTRNRHSLEDIFVRITRTDKEEEGF
jgi:ABC-2 type transport system ATP-binding protein